MGTETSEHPAQNFVQLWAQSLSLVLGQIAGTPFSLLLSEVSPEHPAETATDLFVTVTASGPIQGEMGFRLPQTTAVALAKIFLQDTSATEELTDDGCAAIEELLRQVAGYVTTAAKPMLPELGLSIALTPAFTWPPAAIGWISSTEGVPRTLAVEWRLSAGLEAVIVKAVQEKGTIVVPEPPLSAEMEAARLGFFLDLELEVTLRFGAKLMLLKDVLELSPGSVLELDRDIQDAADLLLDGKLIARGEVVIVNGNYGLRIGEVFAAPQLAA